MTPRPPTAETASRVVVTAPDGTSEVQRQTLEPPGRGEFILRLEACGLCGTDLFKIEQRRSAQAADAAPIVLGHELVGRVEVAGEDAGWQVGQRVVVAHHVPCGRCRLCRAGAETSCDAYRENLLVPGGFSERVLIRERAARHSTFAFDDRHDVRDLVFLEPLACVLRCIDRGGPEGSGRALILGGGSMGLLHLLALRATRPEADCTVVERDAARRELIERIASGADDRSPETMPEPPTDVGSRQSFDVVFDTVGRPELLDQALGLLRPGGTAVLFAHGPAGEPLAVDFHRVFRNELTITASYSSGRADQISAYELLAGGRIQPGVLVTHRLPLSGFDQAVHSVQNREALKAILVPDESS